MLWDEAKCLPDSVASHVADMIADSKLVVTCKDYKRQTYGYFFSAFSRSLPEPLRELPLDSYPVEVVQLLCDMIDSWVLGGIILPDCDLSDTALYLLGSLQCDVREFMTRLPLRSVLRLVHLALYLDCDFALKLAVSALKLALVTGQTLESDEWVGLGNHLSWETYAEVQELLPGVDLLQPEVAFVRQSPDEFKRWTPDQLQRFFEEAVRQRSSKMVKLLLDDCVWTAESVEELAKLSDDMWHEYVRVVPIELLTKLHKRLNKDKRREVLYVRAGDRPVMDMHLLVEEEDWISVSLLMRCSPPDTRWPELMEVVEFKYLVDSIMLGQHPHTFHPILRWCTRENQQDCKTDDLSFVLAMVGCGHFNDIGADPEAIRPLLPLVTFHSSVYYDEVCQWHFKHDPPSRLLLASMMINGRFDDFLKKHGHAITVGLLREMEPCEHGTWSDGEVIECMLKCEGIEFVDVLRILPEELPLSLEADLVLRFPREMRDRAKGWFLLMDEYADRLPQSLEQTMNKSLVKSLPQTLSETLELALPQTLSETLGRSLAVALPQSMPQSLLQSLPESFEQSLTQSLTRSLTRSLTQSLTQSLTRSVAECLPECLAQSLSPSSSRKRKADELEHSPKRIKLI